MTLLSLLKAVHVLAVVVWIGGMVFAHFFLRPSLTLLEPAQRVRLMHEVLRRFFTAVLVASGAVLASGLWIIAAEARRAAASGGAFIWPLDWALMTAVGLLMIALFGHIRFVLFKRLDRAVRVGEVPAAAAALAQIRRWVAANLSLGLALIALVILL